MALQPRADGTVAPFAGNVRVDRLIVDNFKSFRGTQEIGPFLDFTSVIGPNGAGKSNTMDAISFVLGVHSKDLRGKQLRDLIFRTPDGKSDARRASVTLCLTVNGTERRLCRTITAAGSSEYSVEGTRVPYDKYERTLADCSINVRARSFLVFQGDVSEVASKTPQELTSLFERLSGSEALRGEYEEAVREKKDTEDIMIDNFSKRKSLVGQRAQLRTQRDEAAKFERMDEQAKGLRRRSALLRLYEMESAIAGLEVERQRALARHSQARSASDAARAAADESKRAAARHARERMQLERKAAAAAKAVERLKPEGIKLQSEIGHLDKQIAISKKSAEGLKGKRAAHSDTLKGLRKEVSEVEAAEKAADDDFKREEARQPELQLTDEQKARRAELSARAGARTAEMQEALAAKRREVRACERAVAQLAEEKSAAEADSAAAEEQAAGLAERAEGTAEEMTKHKDAAEAAAATVRTLQAEGRDAEARAVELRRQLDEGQARLGELRADRAESEREAKLRESLEALQRHVRGVYGRLTDLCEPTRSQYDLACTVALGKTAEAVVVDTEATARECIKYLKEQRYAPQTFVPLDGIRPKPIPDRLRRLGGTTVLVFDVLRFDHKYEPAVRYGAADTLVCDALDEARELCYRSRAAQHGERFKVVTLDGTLIAKSGMMTGGDDGGDAGHGFRAGGRGGGHAGGGSGGGRPSKWDQRKYTELSEELDAAQKELHALERKPKQRGEKCERAAAAQQSAESSLREAKADLTTTRHKLKSSRERAASRRADGAKASAALGKEQARLSKVTAEESELVAAARATGREELEALSREVGVDDIGAYEEEVSARRRTHAAKKLEFERVVGRLRAQLQHEERKGIPAALAKLEETMRAHEDERKDRAAALDAWKARHAAAEAAKADADGDLEASLSGQRELDGAAKTAKSEGASAATELEAAAKVLATVDGQMEGRREERRAAFGRARLEEVELPLREPGEGGADHADLARERVAAEVADAGAVAPGGGGGDGDAEAEGARRGAKRGKRRRAVTAPDAAPAHGAAAAATTAATPFVLVQSESFCPSGFIGTGTAEGAHAAGPVTDAGAATDVAAPGSELIRIDFSELAEEDRVDAAAAAAAAAQTDSDLETCLADLRKLSPNLKAPAQYLELEAKIKEADAVFAESRAKSTEAKKALDAVADRRKKLFLRAFDNASASIDGIYKDLTSSPDYPMGGTAVLSLENSDEPYNHGVKFNTMPPAKRFREIDQLSGGERTVAALAFLFALWKVQPSPLFVMDEVDAALDNVNVTRVAEYIREQSRQVQFITISLKDTFYDKSDGLVGVYRNVERDSSESVTFDLRDY